MPELASVPDLLRLIVLPVFSYIAWRDIKTRRVPDRMWVPLAGLAFVLLAWESYTMVTGDVLAFRRNRYFLRLGISVGFLIPLAYLFWLIGGFGGADAKAFFVTALLFPTYPEYNLAAVGVSGPFGSLPVVQTDVGVFSFTILSNTVLLGALYPFALAGKNAVSTGYISPGMLVAKPISWEQSTTEYGTMLELPDRRLIDDLSLSGLRSYFSWRLADLDDLRMYLQWRDCDLEEIRNAPEQFRDPDSIPEETSHPGDGVATDGGEAPEQPVDSSSEDQRDTDEDQKYDDPWGAEAFLDEVDTYGTTAEELRTSLEELSSEDRIWISPGIPFLVPMFAGLILAFTFGDLLFALLMSAGVA